MIRPLIAAAAVLAGCQPMPDSPPANPTTCDVTVSFGSVCCGIDQAARARMSAYVADDRRVTASSERPWGKEGELDLCIAARSGADADALARDLIGLIPPREDGSSAGVVTVRRGQPSAYGSDQ